jgi:hypothetical protein
MQASFLFSDAVSSTDCVATSREVAVGTKLEIPSLFSVHIHYAVFFQK